MNCVDMDIANSILVTSVGGKTLLDVKSIPLNSPTGRLIDELNASTQKRTLALSRTGRDPHQL